MKIEVKIDRINDEINLSEQDYEHLMEVLSWEEAPEFEVPGRTGWFTLKDHVKLSDGTIIKALKLKGIGLWNPEGRNAKVQQAVPIPPTDETYRRRSLHVGFKQNGEIIQIPSEDAPYGGIVLRRARMEYDSADALRKNHVPTIIPYMVVEYPELKFHGNSMAVAVCGSCEAKPYRLLHLGWENEYVPENLQDFYQKIAELNNIKNPLDTGKGKLELSVILGKQYGKAMRGLTETQLYIHSGGWDNIQYDFNAHNVFLTDLDSTRGNHLISDKIKAISGVRDLASCIYRYVNKLYYPKAIGNYEICDFLEYDVIESLVCGYFDEIDTASIKKAVKGIWKFYLPYFYEMKRLGEDLSVITSPQRKKLKVELDLFYIVCLHYLYPIMLKSNSSVVKPDSLTVDEFEQHIKSYLKERYSYYSVCCLD